MRTTIEAHAKASEMRDQALEKRMDRVEKDIGSLRKTVIVTGISVVLGVAGLNATILQNRQTSFDSGRQVSAAQAEVHRQSLETDVKLKEIDKKLRQIDALYDTIQKKVFAERSPGAR